MSQLVAQTKVKTSQLSEIPQWDSIGVPPVQSSGLAFLNLAKIYRLTEYFWL